MVLLAVAEGGPCCGWCCLRWGPLPWPVVGSGSLELLAVEVKGGSCARVHVSKPLQQEL